MSTQDIAPTLPQEPAPLPRSDLGDYLTTLRAGRAKPAQEPPPQDDPVSMALRLSRFKRDQNLAMSWSVATHSDPDLAAEAKQLSDEAEQLGLDTVLHPLFIERNIDRIRELHAQRKFERVTLDDLSPELRQRYEQDPWFLRMSWDDAENLSFLENVWSKFTATPGEIGQFLYALRLGPYAGLELRQQAVSQRFEAGRVQVELGRLAGQALAERRALTAEERVRATELQRRLADLPHNSPGFLSATAMFLGQMFGTADQVIGMGAMGAGAGASIGMVGGPAAPVSVPAGALFGFGAGAVTGVATSTYDIEAGTVYLDLLDAGVPPERAAVLASTHGVFAAATEAGAIGVTGKFILGPVARRLFAQGAARELARPVTREAILRTLQNIAIGTAAETGQEIVQEMSNIMVERAAGLEVPDPWERVGEIAAETLSGAMFLAGVPAAIRLSSDLRQVDAAEQQHAMFQSLMGAAQGSKTRERSSSAFESFVMASTKGEQPTHVYLDAEQAAQTLAQSGIAPQTVDQSIPGFSEQLQAGVATGTQVAIPIAEYTRLAGTPVDTALRQDLQFAPNAPSLRQAQEIRKESKALVAEMGKKLDEQVGERDAFEKSAKVVHDRMLGELTSTERLVEADARRAALVHREIVEGLTARLNLDRQKAGQDLLTPEQVDEMFPHRVRRGEKAPETPGLAQAELTARETELLDRVNSLGGFDAFRAPFVERVDAARKKVGRARSDKGRDQAQQNLDFAEQQLRTVDDLRTKVEALRSQRGAFDIASLTTTLFEAADFSTFMHEAAHFYLTVIGQITASADAPAQIRADMETFLRWTGFDGTVADWNVATFETQRPHHEAFAHAFEVYLWEGKAPSKALERLFAGFRALLIRVYRAIRADHVIQDMYRANYGREMPALTGEIRKVMDRMLASDQAIQHAAAIESMEPLFLSKAEWVAAGRSEASWEDYLRAIDEAREEAQTDLTKASLRAVRWIRPARRAEERRITRRRRAARKAMRAEVARQVELRPVYRARSFLRGGKLLDSDGNVIPWDEQQKLDRETSRRMVPGGWIPTAPGTEARGNLRLLAGMTVEEGGLAPDDVAALFDYRSGQAMVEDILSAPPLREAIEAETDRRMEIEHSELVDPEQIQSAIDRAIHNQARARFVAAELRALRGATVPRRVMLDAARDAARTILAREKMGRVVPRRGAPALSRSYAAAARRAAQKAQQASVAGKTRAAIFYKRQELLQTTLVHELQRLRLLARRYQKLFAKVRRPDKALGKRREVEYVAAARSILAAHGLADDPSTLRPHLEQIKKINRPRYEELLPLVEEATREAGTWQDMASGDFLNMARAIEALWDISRREKQIEIEGHRELLADVRAKIVAALGSPKAAALMRTLTKKEKKARWWSNNTLWARQVESLAIQLDGGTPGIIHRYIWQILDDPFNNYLLEREDLIRTLHEALKTLDFGDGRAIEAPELNGFVFTRGKVEVLGFLRHMGNESNRRKEMVGRRMIPGLDGLSDEDMARLERKKAQVDTSGWRAFLDRMIRDEVVTKADMDYLQLLWNLYERLWPRTQEEFKKSFGYRPETIPATAIETPWGMYRGGYVPAKVDYDLAEKRPVRETDDLLDSSEVFRESNAPRRGHTFSRVEYNQPLSHDLALDAVNLDEHVRFIHLQNPSRDLQRILLDKAVRAAFEAVLPGVVDEAILSWMQRTVNNVVVGRSVMLPALRGFLIWLRRATGKARMFANLRVGVQQLAGLGPSLNYVKPNYLRSGVLAATTQPHEAVKRVTETSKFMRTRITLAIGQIRDDIDILTQPGGKLPRMVQMADQWTNRHGYFLQRWFQIPVDIATWLGRYEQSIAEGRSEAQAIRDADSAVRRSQSSGRAIDLSRLEASDPTIRLFLQFGSFWFTQYNSIAESRGLDTRNARIARSLSRTANAMLLSGLVAGTMMKALEGGWDDDDDDGRLWDDVASWAFDETVSGGIAARAPVIGPLVQRLVTGKYGGRLTFAGAGFIEAASRAPGLLWDTLAQALSSDEEIDWTGRDIKDVMTLASIMLGIPLTALGDRAGYWWDVDRGQIEPESQADFFRGIVTGSAGRR